MTDDQNGSLQTPRDQAVYEAITCLVRYNISFRHLSNLHLKIGPWNYHPTTGTVYRDGDACALPARGLPVLLRAIGIPVNLEIVSSQSSMDSIEGHED